MNPFLSRLYRIEWGQCDPAGIVFAPRYLDMFTENMVRMFESAGVPNMRDKTGPYAGVGTPSVEVSARFLRPASYGDEVLVESAAPEFGNSSFTIAYRLLLDGATCVEATEKRVWTVRDPSRPAGLRAERVPDEIRAFFAKGA